MKPKQLATTLNNQLRRWFILGTIALTLTWVSSFSDLHTSAMAGSLDRLPLIAASSTANKVKGQVDKLDQTLDDVKGKVDSASKDTARKAKDFTAKVKDKASKDLSRTQAAVKDVKSDASSKAKRDIAKTQQAADDTKSAVASRAKQDASKTENVFNKAGNKAEELASNVLDTAKNILGQ